MCVCACASYLQFHEGSQSLHHVQVNSGLAKQKQAPLLPDLPFDSKSVRQNSLSTRAHARTHTAEEHRQGFYAQA